jgi:ParB family chromosome partitioning protein
MLLPRAAADAWGFVAGLSCEDLLGLLAHCASLTLNAVRNPLDRRPLALAHADALAQRAGLDMTRYWSVSGASYLAQVTKARIVEAVGEGASPEAAAKLADLKRPAMVEAAEAAPAGTGWLPTLLRTAAPEAKAAVGEAEDLPAVLAAE